MLPANFPRAFESFLSLSAVLTGFERIQLLGTGVARAYFDEFTRILGPAICDELWQVAGDVFAERGADPETEVRKRILSDPKLGPVAKNITVTWYLARWYQMPQEWRLKYGRDTEGDYNHTIGEETYPEGLVWRAIDSHPPAAKPTGYGIWSLPPKGGAA